MSPKVLVIRCGMVPYEQARATQARLETARQADAIPDVLLLLEHPPVYTRGRRSTPQELPMGSEWYARQGIEVRDTDRGGRVTYHGPGQLVAYPIVSLKPYGDDVHAYVRGMEKVAIHSLAAHGLTAKTVDGLTGVWTEGVRPGSEATGAGVRKVGSIGVHVSRGVTTHGLAINVNNDLQPFDWIIPCGIEGCRVTSLSRELGAVQDLAAVGDTIVDHFGRIFDRRPVDTDDAELQIGPSRLNA
jgi:lipoyl(octanoyl) transferase